MKVFKYSYFSFLSYKRKKLALFFNLKLYLYKKRFLYSGLYYYYHIYKKCVFYIIFYSIIILLLLENYKSYSYF